MGSVGAWEDGGMNGWCLRKGSVQGNDATTGSETVTAASTMSPDDPEGCDGECWCAWDDGGMADCLSAVKMAKEKGQVSATEARIHKAEFDVARNKKFENLRDISKICFPPTQVIGSLFVLT